MLTAPFDAPVSGGAVLLEEENMSEHDHNIIVEQDSSGGYICTVCGETSLLVLATGKWMHESENTASLLSDIVGRAEVKDFKPRGPQNYTSSDFIDVNTWYKNRREALFCSVSAQTLDSSDEDIFELAERMEEWLNRPLGQYDHIRVEVEGDIHTNGPDVLHVIKDEVQDLP